MSEAEIAYLAGIIDGEGWVGWAKRDANLRLHITSTTPALIDWLLTRAGGTTYTKSPKGRLGRKPCTDWKVSGERAAIILRAALPYLIIKRDTAAELIARWEAGEAAIRPARRHGNVLRQRQQMEGLGWPI